MGLGFRVVATDCKRCFQGHYKGEPRLRRVGGRPIAILLVLVGALVFLIIRFANNSRGKRRVLRYNTTCTPLVLRRKR